MKSLILIFVAMCSLSVVNGAERDSMVVNLSLDDAIALATKRSVSMVVAENQKLTAYWRYNSYKAEMLPEISFSGALPSYSQSYTTYQKDDGSYTFLKSDYLNLTGGLQVTQNIPLTGGSIAVQSSLDFMRQIGSTNEFMSVPIAITLTQPIFGVNNIRWSKRIEPLQYEESMIEYDEDVIDITLSVIAKYFNALLSKSQLDVARENLKNSDELYKIAKGREKIGDISQRDLSQLELQALQAKATVTEGESNLRAQMFQLSAFLTFTDGYELSIEAPTKVPSGRLEYYDVLDLAMEHSSFAKSVIRRSLESEYEVATAKGSRRAIDLYASFGYTGIGDRLNESYTNTTTNQIVRVGVVVPILDWGKRKSEVKMAESNQRVVEAQIAEEKISFKQDIFLLVENYNNQAAQFEISTMAKEIASRNYNTTFQTFISGDSDILTLNDARERRDAALQTYIEQMYLYWNYYYQIERLCLRNMDVIIGSNIIK